MIIVKTKDELKDAVLKREHILVTDKKLAKLFSSLIHVKKDRSYIEDLLYVKSDFLAASMISSLGAIPISVAITLIVTIGLVTIIAILRNYRIIRRKDGDIVLEPA